MLKVMVVDDEAIFREFLLKTIDWESYGFKISGEAKNGLEALEQAAIDPPDIALIDINMPLLDGLALAQRFRMEFPQTAIVFVTGYNEFEYARKAVKLGVADYILKPFAKEELLATLCALKNKVKQQKDFEVSVKADYNAQMKESFLNSLLDADYNHSDIDTMEKFQYFGLPLQSLDFQVAVIEIACLSGRAREDERTSLKGVLCDMMAEVTPPDFCSILFSGPEGRIISILEFANDQDRSEKALLFYKELCRKMREHTGRMITIGVGGRYHGFKNLCRSYLEALTALDNRLLLGEGRVISYMDSEIPTNAGFFPSEIIDDLLMGLRAGDWSKIEEKLRVVFSYIQDRHISLECTYLILTTLVSLCLSFIADIGVEMTKVFGNNFQPYTSLRQNKSINALRDWINDLFYKTITYTNCRRSTKAGLLIERVLCYINTHFADSELSVEKIAKNVYVNSGYLRSIFKKEVGMTIIDYITSIRLQKARKILETGGIKLAEIAKMVGYNDASYFSKCFKKHYGMTPTEYETIKVMKRPH